MVSMSTRIRSHSPLYHHRSLCIVHEVTILLLLTPVPSTCVFKKHHLKFRPPTSSSHHAFWPPVVCFVCSASSGAQAFMQFCRLGPPHSPFHSHLWIFIFSDILQLCSFIIRLTETLRPACRGNQVSNLLTSSCYLSITDRSLDDGEDDNWALPTQRHSYGHSNGDGFDIDPENISKHHGGGADGECYGCGQTG